MAREPADTSRQQNSGTPCKRAKVTTGPKSSSDRLQINDVFFSNSPFIHQNQREKKIRVWLSDLSCRKLENTEVMKSSVATSIIWGMMVLGKGILSISRMMAAGKTRCLSCCFLPLQVHAFSSEPKSRDYVSKSFHLRHHPHTLPRTVLLQQPNQGISKLFLSTNAASSASTSTTDNDDGDEEISKPSVSRKFVPKPFQVRIQG